MSYSSKMKELVKTFFSPSKCKYSRSPPTFRSRWSKPFSPIKGSVGGPVEIHLRQLFYDSILLSNPHQGATQKLIEPPWISYFFLNRSLRAPCFFFSLCVIMIFHVNLLHYPERQSSKSSNLHVNFSFVRIRRKDKVLSSIIHVFIILWDDNVIL